MSKGKALADRERASGWYQWFPFGWNVWALLTLTGAVAVGLVGWRWAAPITVPICADPPGAPASGCMAGFPIRDLDLSRTGTMALSADGARLMLTTADPPALVALRTDDGREDWRVSLAPHREESVALSPRGDRVAVWGPALPPRILSIPDGAVVAPVAKDIPSLSADEQKRRLPAFDVTFVPSGDALVFGSDLSRRLHPLSGTAPAPDPAAAAIQDTACSSSIGQAMELHQSESGRIVSRDFRLAVLFGLQNADRPSGRGSASGFRRDWLCGVESFLMVPPPPQWWPDRAPSVQIATFSPANDRVALAYSDGSQTLITILDTSVSAPREKGDAGASARSSDRRWSTAVLAHFLMRGSMDFGRGRIGWSPDGRRFVVVTSVGDQRSYGQRQYEARIFAVP